MIKSIFYNDKEIRYILNYKKVKNINLRVKPDGIVYVSAPKRVGVDYIEGFVLSKGDFILNALERQKPMLTREFDRDLVLNYFVNRAGILFKNFKGIDFPEFKVRKMKSRWGSCNTKTKVITLNLYLFNYNEEFIDYVIVHELAHLIQANHSKEFYKIIEGIMPDYKQIIKNKKDRFIS